MPSFDTLLKAANVNGLPFIIALMCVFLGSYAGWVAIRRWDKLPVSDVCQPDLPAEDEENEEDTLQQQYEKLFKELPRHPFFSSMQYAIKYRIPHLDIPEPCRRLLFRDLLRLKFTVFRDDILGFIRKGDLTEMSVDHFHEALVALVSQSVMEYERSMREHGIPDVVIERFGTWHQNTLDMIMELIDNASTSRFYVDNNARMVAILDWLQAAFQITLLDAEKTLNSLNGELDGLVYRGVKAHCKHRNRCVVCELPPLTLPRPLL